MMLVSYFVVLIYCSFLQKTITSQIIETLSNSSDGNRTDESFLPLNETEVIKLNEMINETELNTTLQTSVIDIHSPKNSHHSIFGKKDFKGPCGCDLTFGSCDVNCCCDHECLHHESMAFHDCNDNQLPDSYSCIQNNIVYKKNVPYKVTLSTDKLFCVVRDNFVQRYNYKVPQEGLMDLDHLKSQMVKNPYSWNENDQSSFAVIEEMKAGTPLYKIECNAHKIKPWALPSSLFTNECQAKDAIEFLKPQKSTCTIRLLRSSQPCSHSSLNASSYYGFFILRSLTLINDSLAVQPNFCQETDACIPVMPAEYFSNTNGKGIEHIFYNKTSRELPFPQYEKNLSTCINIVRKILYTIEHNGTAGLLNVTASFQLGKMDADVEFVGLEFETVYIWASTINGSYMRSGNPGYLVGHPVLAGVKSSSNETTEDGQFIVMNKDSRKWLTILRSHNDGLCKDLPETRSPVNFGENLMSGCTLRIVPHMVKSCTHLQEFILLILNGTGQPDHIGSFGNSNIRNISEWVPLHFENSATGHHPSRFLCQSIVTGMNIDIYYAATGTLSNPQHKIIGVFVQYKNHVDIDLSCGNVDVLCKSNLSVLLTSAINFKDVSQPAIQIFGQPPSLRASIPADFFYPFTLSSQAPRNFNTLILCVFAVSFYVALFIDS